MKIVNYQRYTLPNLTRRAKDDPVCLVDILTKDDAGMYAVYRCIMDETEDRPETWLLERAAGRGEKLRLDVAIHSFPQMNRRTYRS